MSTRLTKAEMAELIPAVLLLAAQLEEYEQELEAFVKTAEPTLVRGVVLEHLTAAWGIKARRERVERLLEKLQKRQQP